MSLESAPNRHPDRSQTSSLDQLSVRLIREDELGAWKQLMREHHYLGFRAVVGESLFYVAEIEGRWAALLGWGAAALKCGSRDRYLGWSAEQKWGRLRYLANNVRFLVLPGFHVPNLASKVLSLNLRRISADFRGGPWPPHRAPGDLR